MKYTKTTTIPLSYNWNEDRKTVGAAFLEENGNDWDAALSAITTGKVADSDDLYENALIEQVTRDIQKECGKTEKENDDSGDGKFSYEKLNPEVREIIDAIFGGFFE